MLDPAPQFIPASKLAAMTGDSLATFYRRLSAGFYPRPIRCGSRAVRWNLDTVCDYLRESEHAGRLLRRDEWEAVQTIAARQEKQIGRTRQTSDRFNMVRHSSQPSGVTE